MFEVGKTYKTRNGQDRNKVVAVAEDGRLIVEIRSISLAYRNSDGTSSEGKSFDLISDEATSEERELFAQIMEAMGFNLNARMIRNRETHGNYAEKGLTKFVEILRNK